MENNNNFELNNSQTYDVLVSINGSGLEFRARGWKIPHILSWFEELPLDTNNVEQFFISLDGTMVYLDAGEVLKV